ncbi:MAG: hypothetical protein KJ847_06145 [Firmicutes bacterium]|nr:hypothetical protein [Bacillota bacterium]
MKKKLIIIASVFMTCLLAFAVYKGIPDTRKYEDFKIGEYDLYYDQLYIFTFCHDVGEQLTLYENEWFQWDYKGVKTAIGCYSNLYIKNADEFITLTEAVELGLITEEEVIHNDLGLELIQKDKLNVDETQVIRIESSIFDETSIVTDSEQINRIIEELNNVGFVTGNQCELCNYSIEMGYIIVFFTEEDFMYISLTRGGAIYGDQYSMYDDCDLVQTIFDIFGECPFAASK